MSNQSRGSLESALLATNRGGMKSPTWLGPDQLDVDVPVVLAEDDLRVAAMTGRAAEEELARLRDEQRRAELNYAIVRVEADEAIKALEKSRTTTASAVGLFAGSKAEHEKAVRCILAVAKNEDPDGEALGYLVRSKLVKDKIPGQGDTLLHMCMANLAVSMARAVYGDSKERLRAKEKMEYLKGVVQKIVSADAASIYALNSTGGLPIESADFFLIVKLMPQDEVSSEYVAWMLDCARLCDTGDEKSKAVLYDMEVKLGVRQPKPTSERQRRLLLAASKVHLNASLANLRAFLGK